jgi:hypothetical protein
MITAKEAKAISNRYTPDIITERELSFIERNIMEAADIGHTSTIFTIHHSKDILNRILDSLNNSGYFVCNYGNNDYYIYWGQPTNENQTTPNRETP